MSRVLVVYGSETGQSKESITAICKTWKSTHPSMKVTGPMEGDKAAESFESITKEKYDYLLVATSSYGDGDCPSGYGKFLYKLQQASKGCGEDGSKQLEGIKHAVLGFGSTAYETFQNCPRLTDKFLGLAGSTRVMMRAEVDEMEDDSGFSTRDKWVADIESIIKKKSNGGVPDLKPVCEWTEPKSEVYDKNLGPDGQEIGIDAKLPTESVVFPFIIALVGFSYWYFFVSGIRQEEGEQ